MATTVIPLKPALTLKQRIEGDATTTAKYIGLAGKAIAGFAAYAGLNIPSIPKSWVVILTVISGIMIAIEQLDVDYNKMATNGTISFTSVFSTIPNIIGEVKTINNDLDTLTTVKVEKANTADLINDIPKITADIKQTSQIIGLSPHVQEDVNKSADILNEVVKDAPIVKDLVENPTVTNIEDTVTAIQQSTNSLLGHEVPPNNASQF